MKDFLKILTWIGLFLWQLPQNLIALFILLFSKERRLICTKRYAWCIKSSFMKSCGGSISLGNFCLCSTAYDTTLGHELGHVVYSHYFGPLYLVIIGIPSLIWAALWTSGNYYAFFTERWANTKSHLHEEKNTWGNCENYHLVWDDEWDLDRIV